MSFEMEAAQETLLRLLQRDEITRELYVHI